MFRLRFLLGFTVALLHPAYAQIVDLNPEGLFSIDGNGAGTTAFSFLKLPISARSIGLAATTLTTDEEATLVQGNPAGLAMTPDYFYSFSHAEILGEFRHENIAFTWPSARFGNFGGSANVLATTVFEGARDIDENRIKPEAYDIALGLAYGKSVWEERFLVGGRLDLIRSSLDGTTAYGYGINAGLLFLFIHDIRLGTMVKNFSHGTHYDTKTAPVEPLPLSLGVEVGKPLLESRWSAQVGIQQSNDGIFHYYVGNEWRLVQYLLVRMGYDGSSQDRELGPWMGLAFGFGIKYDWLTFDYGYKAMGVLGGYHAFTLNYARKSKLNARDEILLVAAQKKYRAGQYRVALDLARAAIAYNPQNIQAQLLVQKLQLEIDQQNETAISIIFTANTDGRLGSDWLAGHPIGGLARRKTKLLELKGSRGKSLILDAGNLTSTKASLNQEHYVYGAYAQMPYDAINLGAAELALGAAKWDKRLPFLGSQKPFQDSLRSLLILKKLSLDKGGEVLVLGGLDSVNGGTKNFGPEHLEGIASAVRRLADKPKPKRILILLLNGNLNTAHLLAAKVPELDAIILSGEAQALGVPMKAGKTLVCSPGLGGTHIGELTFLLDKEGKIRSFRHFLIPLDASIPEDPELRKFLEPVTIDPNKLAVNDFEDDYHAQIIAYIRASEAGLPAQPFLQDLSTGKNYAVPTEGMDCRQPIIGYGKNKLAFTGVTSEGAREIFAFEVGSDHIDTLTKMGGKAMDIRWAFNYNAILASYAEGKKSELYRIDPWNHEVRDLSLERFGKVRGFDITTTGDKIAFDASLGNSSTLWVTSADLGSPVAVLTDTLFFGAPRWNIKGDKLAFLASSHGDTALISGELRVYDFIEKKIVSATEKSRVYSFTWSADGKRIFYSAGVNLLDINVFSLDTLTLKKVTLPAAIARSEENPSPKIVANRDGLLFESVEAGRRGIYWVDFLSREEKVIVDSAGYNSLK
jgi:Tol biopolymer transport system component